MVVGAFLGVFFIPLFFVVVQKWFGGHERALKRRRQNTAVEAEDGVQKS
jgi:hypothetical protein